MKYIIREIQQQDNLFIEQVIRTCLIEYQANHEGTAWTDPNLGCFSKIYNSPGNKYWVVIDENDQVVGGTGIGGLTDTVCELQKMYCLTEVRGKGISDELINIALNYATKYYQRCYLETLDNMTRAIAFYHKHGFVKTDEQIVTTDHYACNQHYIKELRK